MHIVKFSNTNILIATVSFIFSQSYYLIRKAFWHWETGVQSQSYQRLKNDS